MLLLLAPALASAAALSVSGSPRLVNTLQPAWPPYACMNPVATGGAGSYQWDFASNPGNHFTIDPVYGTVAPVAPITMGSYPITVRVTDLNNTTATESVTISVVNTGLVVLGTDTIFDNYAGSSWFGTLGILASGFADSATGTTWTMTDPSGNFGIVSGYNDIYFNNGTPPAGDYPVTISLSQAGVGSLGPFNFTIHVVHAQQITSINYAQNIVSTSQGAGVAAGTASTTVWEPGYQWSIPSSGSDGGTFTILNPATGVVTLTRTPVPGDRNITIQVTDGLNTYSQPFVVHVVQGATVAAGNMALSVPSNLDNYTSSGVLGTPTVTGLTGAPMWSFTGEGVGSRYAINGTTGQITIIGPLSYQPTLNGVDYTDVIAVTCTDGVNTCTNSFRVPVAACVGPVLNVGPGQTYAHLNDAISYCAGKGWGRPFAGVTFNVYPSSDPNYYLNDGQDYPTNGVFPVPVTIQGAPGQTFPKFRGGGLYYGKGFFMGYSYDIWIKNVEIMDVTTGDTQSGNDNEAGVCKEAGDVTGNMFVDNFYIHDCQDGISRGNPDAKWFVTNGRVSHCGVGETGYTHNIYVLGELAYFENVLTDQSSIGHTFKSRAKSTIITNCRMYDGETGHGSIGIDVPEGGTDSITNTVVQKGPNYQNPNGVHFADAGDSEFGWPANQMNIAGSSFFDDADVPGNVTAVVDASLAGNADGIPAPITLTGNSYFEFPPANYEKTSPNPAGGLGATSVTGSVSLTAQPPLDYSFPGPGPDPTVASPPGPFLAPYGVVNGAQITLPVDDVRIDSASPAGTSVVNPAFLPGQFSCPSPTWSLRKNPGNRYAINPATGAITTAAALIPGMVDVVQIQVSQPGVNFGQDFSPGSEGYNDPPPVGSFYHSIYIVSSGNLPPFYAITPSANAGGTISPGGATQVVSGGSQSFTITASTGYSIANVTVDGASVGAVGTYTFSNVTTDHAIAATFTQSPVITASAGANGTITPAGGIVVSPGGSQTFAIAPNVGYIIGGVTVDGTPVGAVTTYTFSDVTVNHTIAATFNIAPTIPIATSAGTGGFIYPNGTVLVSSGQSERVGISASTGHSIANVIVDGASVGAVDSYTFSNVTASHTISATFNVVGSGGTTPVLVDFEKSGDQSQFTNSNFASWNRVAGHGGYMGQIQTYNGPGDLIYSSGGGVNYPVGMDTVSADIDLNYGGTAGQTSLISLILQQKSTSEQYEAALEALNGQITLTVGNLDNFYYNTTGHTAAQNLVVGTYTAGTAPLDLGWYNIHAVTTTINGDQYQAVVTLTKPDGTTATLTYVDTGAARYTSAYPAGFSVFAQGYTNVNIDNFRIGGLPVIATLLGSQTVTAGQSVTFSINATGSGSLTYQWYKNNASLAGATNSSYTIPATSGGDAATYDVVVTDSYGATTSNIYTLNVSPVLATDTPTLPPWALGALALLLFSAALPFLPAKPSRP